MGCNFVSVVFSCSLFIYVPIISSFTGKERLYNHIYMYGCTTNKYNKTMIRSPGQLTGLRMYDLLVVSYSKHVSICTEVHTKGCTRGSIYV